MAKGAGTQTPEIFIVLDTNALFTEAEDKLLNTETTQFIRDSNSALGLKINWCLPEIVVAERRAQMIERANRLLIPLGKLENVLGHKLNITPEIVAYRVEEAIVRNMDEFGLQALQLNPSTVDWTGIVDKAVRKVPPFSPRPEEKGFKDAIVLETLVNSCDAWPKTKAVCRIYFVTKDDILRQAANERLDDRMNFQILGSFDDLRSSLTTISSHLTDDDIAKIAKIAHEKMLTRDDNASLYFKWEVRSKLIQAAPGMSKEKPEGASSVEETAYYIDSTKILGKKAQTITFATSFRFVMTAKFSPSALDLFNALSLNASAREASTSAVAAALGGASTPRQQQKSLPDSAPPPGLVSRTSTGTHYFSLNWSATLSQAGRLIRPKMLGVSYSGARWTDPI